MTTTDWRIFTGTCEPHDGIDRLPPPPPWRPFRKGEVQKDRSFDGAVGATAVEPSDRGRTFQCDPITVDIVNAALYVRRPLLLTGKPGTGKSSLIYAVAHELKLGPVLRWSVTSRSTLRQGLYEYDAIGRLQEAQLTKGHPDIGKYLRLGPLGTALLPSRRPWALLVDEIDKADIDLPNDLLNIFEEGEFEIPELARLDAPRIEVRSHLGDETFPIREGRVRCFEFPFVVLTNNGEREFPPPFLRRCLRLDIAEPDEDRLARIVEAHLGAEVATAARPLIEDFLARRSVGSVATDQLLNAVYLVTQGGMPAGDDHRQRLIDALLRELSALPAA